MLDVPSLRELCPIDESHPSSNLTANSQLIGLNILIVAYERREGTYRGDHYSAPLLDYDTLDKRSAEIVRRSLGKETQASVTKDEVINAAIHLALMAVRQIACPVNRVDGRRVDNTDSLESMLFVLHQIPHYIEQLRACGRIDNIDTMQLIKDLFPEAQEMTEIDEIVGVLTVANERAMDRIRVKLEAIHGYMAA